jgi:flagellar hook-length control protein FliK
VALDSIFSNPVIPPPPKSAKPAASAGSSALGGPSGSGAGNGSDTAIGSGADTSSNSGASAGSASDHSTSTNTSGHSSDSSGTSSSKSSAAASSSSSGAKSSSNAGARSRQTTSQAQSASSKTASGATASKKAAGAKGAANAQLDQNAPPGSFLQALAQTQADAAQNIDAAAAVASQDVTAAAAKSDSDKNSDAASPGSLAFISQSLAAAIAGVQQPKGAQAMAANGAVAAASDDDGATPGVSATGSGGSRGSTIQSLAAALAKDTAEGLKATADANSAAGGAKSDPAAGTTSSAGDASAAVSAFQAQMGVGSHFQTGAPDTSTNRLNAPMGSPAFNEELGGKVTWLANQGIQSASLQMSPEHLGPVNVHISVQDGTASVTFNAAHADTRAALEQALPRLREMFATNGLTLSDANVSQQSPRGQPQRQSISAIGSVGGVGDDSTSSTVTSVIGSRPGLLDTYA